MEASVRFSLASDAMSTVLVGYSTFEHLERAIAVVEKGPLPAPALDLLNGLWAGLAQDARR
jgi:aryl-alcohol dehydrogenase-like predicted oxidoreductase